MDNSMLLLLLMFKEDSNNGNQNAFGDIKSDFMELLGQ